MMRLKQIFGPSVVISEARVYRMANTRAFYAYAFIFLLIIVLWHPLGSLHAAPLYIQAIVWVVGYATFLLTYTFVHLGLLRLSLRLGITTISETLIMFLALALPYPIQLKLMSLLGVDVSDLKECLEFLIFNFVLAELAAFGYLHWVDRVLFPEVYESPEGTPDPERPREVFLRGSSLPIARVEVISASGEGIDVVSMGQHVFVHRPFGLTVSELPVDLGFQIHRSIWISRDVAMRHEAKGRQMYVSTSNGRRLPIARSRQREFQNWVRLIQVKRGDRI